MSRSGYIEDWGMSQEEQWATIRWRGAVKSAIRGKRGQAFLKELLAALDAMDEKRLIANELEANGQFCTLGVIGHARKLDMEAIDPECEEQVSAAFNIAEAMAREIVYENDEGAFWYDETAEQRWQRMRNWVQSQIKAP
ncbi:MAG: hypothetical protein AAF542_17760 [Pseudomonadota bacterium]